MKINCDKQLHVICMTSNHERENVQVNYVNSLYIREKRRASMLTVVIKISRKIVHDCVETNKYSVLESLHNLKKNEKKEMKRNEKNLRTKPCNIR